MITLKHNVMYVFQEYGPVEVSMKYLNYSVLGTSMSFVSVIMIVKDYIFHFFFWYTSSKNFISLYLEKKRFVLIVVFKIQEKPLILLLV